MPSTQYSYPRSLLRIRDWIISRQYVSKPARARQHANASAGFQTVLGAWRSMVWLTHGSGQVRGFWVFRCSPLIQLIDVPAHMWLNTQMNATEAAFDYILEKCGKVLSSRLLPVAYFQPMFAGRANPLRPHFQKGRKWESHLLADR